jgi:hypothetical protein
MALPTYNPGYRELPTYTGQTWNDAEVDSLAQKRAAPGLRALRSQVQRVTGRGYGSPNVTKLTLRDALSGYGQGLENIMSGAQGEAAGEYGQKFGATSGEAYKEYGSKAGAAGAYNAYEADRAKTNFGAEMTDWELATQNKYAQSAREYLTSSQKDLMTFKQGLEPKDDWEKKMRLQSELQKDMLKYQTDLEGEDDWEAKMQKQYDLQQKTEDEKYVREIWRRNRGY